jgi:hypothetical protein
VQGHKTTMCDNRGTLCVIGHRRVGMIGCFIIPTHLQSKCIKHKSIPLHKISSMLELIHDGKILGTCHMGHTIIFISILSNSL